MPIILPQSTLKPYYDLIYQFIDEYEVSSKELFSEASAEVVDHLNLTRNKVLGRSSAGVRGRRLTAESGPSTRTRNRAGSASGTRTASWLSPDRGGEREGKYEEGFFLGL